MLNSKKTSTELYDIYKHRLKFWGVANLIELAVFLFFNPQWLIIPIFITTVTTIRDAVLPFFIYVLEDIQILMDKYALFHLLIIILLITPLVALLFSVLRILVWFVKYKLFKGFGTKIKRISSSFVKHKADYVRERNKDKTILKKPVKIIYKLFTVLKSLINKTKMYKTVSMSSKAQIGSDCQWNKLRDAAECKKSLKHDGVYVRILGDIPDCTRDSIKHWKDGKMELTYPGDSKYIVVLRLRNGQAYIEAGSKKDGAYKELDLAKDAPMTLYRFSSKESIPVMTITWLGGV